MFPFYLYSISGEKISPIEVDAVLLSHPDIAQAVAFGVPDDKYGEEVKLLKTKNLTYYFVLTNVFLYIINVNDPTRAPVMLKWSRTRCLHKHIEKMVTKYLKPHFHTSYIRLKANHSSRKLVVSRIRMILYCYEARKLFRCAVVHQKYIFWQKL